jgi:hypothetical protein
MVVEEIIEKDSVYRSKAAYIVVEERKYMKFNISVKKLFPSWLKSEYIGNSIYQQKIVWNVVE